MKDHISPQQRKRLYLLVLQWHLFLTSHKMMYKIIHSLDIHQLSLKRIKEGFIEIYHLFHSVDFLIHLSLDLLIVLTCLLEVSAQEFFDVGPIDKVIENLGKEFVGFF